MEVKEGDALDELAASVTQVPSKAGSSKPGLEGIVSLEELGPSIIRTCLEEDGTYGIYWDKARHTSPHRLQQGGERFLILLKFVIGIYIGGLDATNPVITSWLRAANA